LKQDGVFVSQLPTSTKHASTYYVDLRKKLSILNLLIVVHDTYFKAENLRAIIVITITPLAYTKSVTLNRLIVELSILLVPT
jgi:hypothetical protein